MTNACNIATVKQSDINAIAKLAYDTGFFGDSLNATPISYDLWKAIYVDPYFTAKKTFGYVAKRGNEILGYIIGGENIHINKYYNSNKIRLIFKAMVGKNIIANIYLLYHLAVTPIKKADDYKYPVHFHMAVRKDSRGNGCGSRLLINFVELARDMGYPGIQIGVAEESIVAINMYRKHMFKEYAKWKTKMWSLILHKEVEYIRMVKSL